MMSSLLRDSGHASPKGGEIAGRLRAARGYAGLRQPELAAALGVSLATLSRMENGRTTVSDNTRREVAAICGVPATFMEVGFDPFRVPGAETVTDRLTAIERRVEDLEHRRR